MTELRMDYGLMAEMITVLRSNAEQIASVRDHLKDHLIKIDIQLDQSNLHEENRMRLQMIRERIEVVLQSLAQPLEEKFSELFQDLRHVVDQMQSADNASSSHFQ